MLLAFISCALVAEAQKLEKSSPQKNATKSEEQNKDSVIGRRVPNFVLPDSTGKKLALSDFSDAKVVVVVFMGTQCPIGNAYVPDLNDLSKRFRDKHVQVIGVNSNLSDSADSIATHVKEFKVTFPVLVDNDQLAVDLFGAQRTPEVFVLDRRRHIRYRGRIDDRVGYDFKKDKSKRLDLEEAVKELVSGEEVSVGVLPVLVSVDPGSGSLPQPIVSSIVKQARNVCALFIKSSPRKPAPSVARPIYL